MKRTLKNGQLLVNPRKKRRKKKKLCKWLAPCRSCSNKKRSCSFFLNTSIVNTIFADSSIIIIIFNSLICFYK